MTRKKAGRALAAGVLFVLLGLRQTMILADDDSDLIPADILAQSGQEAVSPALQKTGLKVYIDEAASATFKHHALAVPLPVDISSWNNRISLDMRAEMTLAPNLSVTLADRFNHFSDEDRTFPRATVQNDLKEFYLTASRQSRFYLDAGRINVKNGVALGFNPTDYFKKNAVRARISEDPAILRENRLGALMVRAQGIWETGALMLALAPEVSHEKDQWQTDAGSMGLGLERTNDSTRFLAKINLNAIADVNPELLYFHDRDHSHLGLNLTKAVGNSLVFYGEWSGARTEDLLSRAIAASREFAPAVPALPFPLLSGDGETHFQHQLAVGFSCTESINRTTYVEYHYHQAGLSEQDWENWFDAGKAAAALQQDPDTQALGTGRLGQLWILRQWAAAAQEPMNRHSLFLRTQWQKAMVSKLDLTGIALVNLTDGSFFVQPMAEYHIAGNITLNLTVNLFIGDRESEYGSLNPMGDLKAGMTCFF